MTATSDAFWIEIDIYILLLVGSLWLFGQHGARSRRRRKSRR